MSDDEKHIWFAGIATLALGTAVLLFVVWLIVKLSGNT